MVVMESLRSRAVRRQIIIPTLLASGVAVSLAVAGLGVDDGGQAAAGGGRASLEPLDLVARGAAADTVDLGDATGDRRMKAVRSAAAATSTTTAPPPTTTTTAPPPPTTVPVTEPPTTAPPPPPPPPPAPEPAPAGGLVCPVQGGASFTDTWGAARSGHTHQGVDMMAAYGTPTVAPVSGTVEHTESSAGGLSWYVRGDDGTTYFGAHLSAFAADGWVPAGTVIGYVGDSGNAAGTPHLHFEVHPGGGEAVNPYPYAAQACG
jgi:murein DD-endopeptidase MepM/ murein hydrolase activator NlpD